MDNSIFTFFCPLVLVLAACIVQQGQGLFQLSCLQGVLAAAPPLPNIHLLYLGLTQAYRARQLPREQQTDFMIIFHPCSIPYSGRTARNKNINQRARLLWIIQGILFHVNIWCNVPFQFSVHFLCLFVTWPTTGQSCTPFRCIQKAAQRLWRGLPTLRSSKLCTAQVAQHAGVQ